MLSDARCPRCGEPLSLSDERPEGRYGHVERFSDGRPATRTVFGTCSRCDLLVENVALMLEQVDADRQLVLDAIAGARRARAIFDRGFGDTARAMGELAGAFHALRRIGPPGIEPWDPDALYAWMQEGRASRHELACAHFVLSVWDSRGPAGTFDAMDALAGWDRAHRAAFVEWAREPWWP